MRKRVYIALAVLLVMLAGVIAWLGLREREPVYQGKRLSVWLQGYQIGDYVLSKDSPKVDAAVRQIGTNALPTLFRMLRAKDSALRVRLMRFAQKHPFIRIKYTPAETLNFRAVAGFRTLGGEAKNAVPELIEMYKHSPGFGPFGPGGALGAIGPDAGDAIPSLLLNVGNTNESAREIAVGVLGEIHSQSQSVVPAMIVALHDPGRRVRTQAFQALGRYGKEAGAAVPALLEILKEDPNPDNRVNAVGALGAIHVDPEVVVPALVTALHDPYAAVGANSVGALEDFGPEAKAAVPGLLEFLKSQDDSYYRSVTTNALKAIDPEAAAKAGVK